MKKRLILITNDDGIHSSGLERLVLSPKAPEEITA